MRLASLFASALKQYRELADMSQEELAADAGLDRTYISQLERGQKSPTLTTLEKLATCLNVSPQHLLRSPHGAVGPRFPADYYACEYDQIPVSRGGDQIQLPVRIVTRAINIAHGLIDDLYAADLDIAAILGLRNLSAFIGELFAAAMVKTADSQFISNPHQDGYPDLLLMDNYGRTQWNRLKGRSGEKGPFSPFIGGGVEVKATCGSVPSPNQCRRLGIERPYMGDTRIDTMTSYDWKAHHQETNNLVGVLWDFIDMRPRLVAVFYSGHLQEDDWGRIVQPKIGGGRTTSVSIMSRKGVRKMYGGWLCVLREGGYAEFLNKRNKGNLVPTSFGGRRR